MAGCCWESRNPQRDRRSVDAGHAGRARCRWQTAHPRAAQPYYLDGPLILKFGQKISADPTAEIRLKPSSNTCLVRNEHVATLNTKPVPADQPLDTDITIEGGIWTTLANAVDPNGNNRGHSSKEHPAFGMREHGRRFARYWNALSPLAQGNAIHQIERLSRLGYSLRSAADFIEPTRKLLPSVLLEKAVADFMAERKLVACARIPSASSAPRWRCSVTAPGRNSRSATWRKHTSASS